MKSPIFLFSLPRSGSTLLQRVLMGHGQIASVAEPWLLLPFLSITTNSSVAVTEYGYDASKVAFGDFIANLPNKEDDYYQALASFASDLYQKQCVNNEQYFLDKTPRYYYIIPEIAKIFPNAKFIFLFRNPVQIMSSVIQTYVEDSLHELYVNRADLYYGPKILSNGYQLLKDKSYALHYEDFVQNPKQYTQEICNYLGLEFTNDMLTNFNDQNTRGRLGDSTGIYEYSSISKQSLDKWQQTFATKFKKQYLTKYINKIDDNVLTALGYDKAQIIKQIDKLPSSDKLVFIRDWYDLIHTKLLFKFLEKTIDRFFHKKAIAWVKGRFLF